MFKFTRIENINKKNDDTKSVCSTFPKMMIFIVMKRTKHLTLRITENQFERLKQTLKEEKKTKSSIMRGFLDSYLIESCRTDTK